MIDCIASILQRRYCKLVFNQTKHLKYGIKTPNITITVNYLKNYNSNIFSTSNINKIKMHIYEFLNN